MNEPHDEQPDPNREWWTPHEVADLFRVHITTVYLWIKKGKLPVTRISRNLYRIKAEDVRRLAEVDAEGWAEYLKEHPYV